MPVRIYDIARELGIENKEVLAKAKELGISGARVPSSSLDKITAEYLVDHLKTEKPAPEPKEVPAPQAHEPILIIKGPAEEEEPSDEADEDEDKSAAKTKKPKKTKTHKDAKEDGHPPVEVISPESEEIQPLAADAEGTAIAKPKTGAGEDLDTDQPDAAPEVSVEKAEEPEAEPTVEPPSPPKSRIGEKVGFIDLPPRPPGRGGRGTRDSQPPPPQRGRHDRRDQRGQPSRGEPPQSPVRPSAEPAAAKPKYVAPASGELIIIKPPIIVRDLAEKLNRKPYQLIADLIELKVMASVNQAVDEDTARCLCAKYGFRFEVEKRERGAGIVHTHVKKPVLDKVEDKPEELQTRAPVVTIMGHVDHGKTTLLDVIRKSDVVSGEAGGITQHIGAYTISVPHPDRKNDLQQITFLDTPGHAAFTAMRARGANVTDIVILVVAANDGVMPQTIEAIDHAKAAGVPIIVAVNKCDHPSANPMRARQQLQERGLMPEDWGGDTIYVDVSALTKEGVDKLLEMIVLQAEIMELKANPDRPARGNVIESGLSPGGPTASVLVRAGTLKVGQMVLCGEFCGKVRALINDEDERLKEAGPSTAVKILGLNGVPEAGLEFNVVKDDKAARMLVTERKEESRKKTLESAGRPRSRESFFDQLDSSDHKELKILIKADTQGSAEAIVDALKSIKSEKVSLEVVHHAVGTITENDVNLASASQAVILGFHTRIDNGVSEASKRTGVLIKLYSIIYELIDEVKDAMAGLLEPVAKETVIGEAEVRKVFGLSKGGNVAGCIVNSGRITKGRVRVRRKGDLLFEGSIQALRRFQDEVNEVRSGMECGIRIDGFQDYEPGDILEAFTVEKVAAKL